MVSLIQDVLESVREFLSRVMEVSVLQNRCEKL